MFVYNAYFRVYILRTASTVSWQDQGCFHCSCPNELFQQMLQFESRVPFWFSEAVKTLVSHFKDLKSTIFQIRGFPYWPSFWRSKSQGIRFTERGSRAVCSLSLIYRTSQFSWRYLKSAWAWWHVAQSCYKSCSERSFLLCERENRSTKIFYLSSVSNPWSN